jgi:hypothetical protein
LSKSDWYILPKSQILLLLYIVFLNMVKERKESAKAVHE